MTYLVLKSQTCKMLIDPAGAERVGKATEDFSTCTRGMGDEALGPKGKESRNSLLHHCDSGVRIVFIYCFLKCT